MRLGTRGSALALAQARAVAAVLGGEPEIVEVRTGGDAGVGASSAEDKSRWVDGLEAALLAGEIDLAVHSAKDVPAQLAAGLEIAGVPEREDARDALAGASSLSALPAGARVGTSSVRRQAELLALRPDLDVVALRGNVDTRLRKLAAGEADAAVLAVAGLRRLGRADAIGAVLDLVPAAGQGALLLEGRAGDATVHQAAGEVTDPRALASVTAERACVAALGATCHTPVGAHARPLAGGRLALTAFAGRADGSAWVRDEREGAAADPAALGADVADRLLRAGAAEVLAG